jgi:hypothetical protein
MNLSFTPNEIIARRVVDKLCRRPPYGQSWREFAVREISGARTAQALRRKREEFDRQSTGKANAAAPG